ncbi:hypothetical protein KGY79_04110 [Candidatus Bipolaricaulota bacterium]|nr:hypothetical protein [Candidatus Bipolaricaulota bacterium]
MAYGRSEISYDVVAELIPIFKNQLKWCNLGSEENLLVVTDTAFNPVYSAACFGAARQIGADVHKVVLSHREDWNEDTLRGFFSTADLILYPTTHPLHYSVAMKEALEEGKRALCVMVPLTILERRTANADIIERTKRGAELLGKADEIRITSESGTDLSMKKGDRPAIATYGVADEAGRLDFWGGGFFQTAQLEGTTEGELVLAPGDQIFYLGRYVESETKIIFEEGKAVAFEGGTDAALVANLLKTSGGVNSLKAGHIAVGTDPDAIWSAETIQFPQVGGGGIDAEAYYGNVQVEIGSNNDVLFQGENPANAHLGLCMLDCDLYLDGKKILQKGEFLPEDMKANCLKESR